MEISTNKKGEEGKVLRYTFNKVTIYLNFHRALENEIHLQFVMVTFFIWIFLLI